MAIERVESTRYIAKDENTANEIVAGAQSDPTVTDIVTETLYLVVQPQGPGNPAKQYHKAPLPGAQKVTAVYIKRIAQ